MADDEIKCGNCRFFNDGECRRHAPVVLGETAEDTVWPIVSRSDWCGDFQRAKPASQGEYT
jgi:hypothetical protein